MHRKPRGMLLVSTGDLAGTFGSTNGLSWTDSVKVMRLSSFSSRKVVLMILAKR
jgi:hypothetical protein